MVRGGLLMLTLVAAAPYQCKSNDPERARDETPGEALWALCGQLADAHDDAGAKLALDAIVDRYPSSRYAKRAEEERGAAHPCAGVTAALGSAHPRSSASAGPSAATSR